MKLDRRFSLASALVVLAAGAIYLWLHPDQAGSPSPPSATTSPTTTTVPHQALPQRYVLAISWEPAFCEGASSKPECRSQSASRSDAGRFSLHGIWPDDEYCGVGDAPKSDDKSGRWDDLPAVRLSTSVAADLDRVMPGTQSHLERHEWLKHGTCSGVTPDVYFGRAILFLETINNSAVGRLFAGRIGKHVGGDEVRAAFDTAFGSGAGDRVRLACTQDGDRRLVTEITLGLRGDVMGSGAIGDLIAASGPTDPGCNGAMVDRVGAD